MIPLIEKLIKKNQFSFVVVGSSMRPIIEDNDVVHIRRSSFARLKLNDIIFFSYRNSYKIHRIIYKQKTYVVTKGDNTLHSDGRVKPHQIFGKVYKIKRGNFRYSPDYPYILQSSYYAKEILQIISLFEQFHICYVILKGLPLHFKVFNDFPNRLYTDIDILIDKKSESTCQKLLLEHGYARYDSSYSPIHRILKRKPTEISFYKRINAISVIIDLHWEPSFLLHQVSPLSAIYPEKYITSMTFDFLKSRTPISFRNKKTYILRPVHLVVYLLLHLFHHNFRGTARYEMINAVIRRYASSTFWDELCTYVYQYRLNGFILPSLYLLNRFYSIPIPDYVYHDINRFLSLRTSNYIKTIIKNVNIFDNENKVKSGIQRFWLIYNLSMEPFWKKIFIFLHPAVIFSTIWVGTVRVSRLSLFRK